MSNHCGPDFVFDEHYGCTSCWDICATWRPKWERSYCERHCPDVYKKLYEQPAAVQHTSTTAPVTSVSPVTNLTTSSPTTTSPPTSWESTLAVAISLSVAILFLIILIILCKKFRKSKKKENRQIEMTPRSRTPSGSSRISMSHAIAQTGVFSLTELELLDRHRTQPLTDSTAPLLTDRHRTQPLTDSTAPLLTDHSEQQSSQPSVHSTLNDHELNQVNVESVTPPLTSVQTAASEQTFVKYSGEQDFLVAGRTGQAEETPLRYPISVTLSERGDSMSDLNLVEVEDLVEDPVENPVEDRSEESSGDEDEEESSVEGAVGGEEWELIPSDVLDVPDPPSSSSSEGGVIRDPYSTFNIRPVSD